MHYTQIPQEISVDLNRVKAEPYNVLKVIDDPSSFSMHVLGITPYTYQHLVLQKSISDKTNRLIICKSRQIGISICLAVLAIWYAAYNKANGGKGTGIHKNTKVGIISKSDSQSKKLMREIQSMIWSSKHDFKLLVKQEGRTPLNKSEMHFSNGWIKCYPPTDSCRGESFDLVIVDEAAFVDAEIFKDAIEPTVSAVNGKIILSSTPKGQSGFFWELFDPENIKESHEYERFWFYCQIV